MSRVTAQQIRVDRDRHVDTYIATAYLSDQEVIEKEFESEKEASSWLKALIALMNMKELGVGEN